MQKVKHESDYKSIHIMQNYIDDFYCLMSDDSIEKPLFPPVYDISFKELYDAFKYNHYRRFIECEFEEFDIEKLKLPKYDKKNIIVCYSGGKDSFTAIRHYQKMGYNVYAYHIKGLNKGYTDEWKVVEEASKKYGFNLIIDKVSYSGQHVWIEHPMKNMVMASMALTYGVRSGITTKIAVGSFRTAYLADNSFEVCAGDCIDMWRIYDKIINRFLPGYKTYVPNLNFMTSLRMLQNEPESIKYTISCLTPNRFRGLFRERTQKAYNIELLENRCGCCWKCAAEYIWFCDNNVFEYNQEYYIHCIEVLLHTVEQETGYKVYDIDYVWSVYLGYSMKKSKAWELLKDAVIRTGKVEITSKDVEG